MEYFDEDVILPNQRVGLELGRGCIFKCTFCEFNLIGKEKGTYTRSTSRLEDELKRNWEEYGVNRYWITDDTLNDDTKKLERIFLQSNKLITEDVIKQLPYLKVIYTRNLKFFENELKWGPCSAEYRFEIKL